MKVFLDTIGCRLNQSEIEAFANQFRQAGHSLVSEARLADLIVVNTCAVTAEAASDSRQRIRQAARASQGEVVVTGCWSTLDPEKARQLPGVSRVIPNDQKDRLVPTVLELPAEAFDLEPLAREPLPGIRQRTRAFIKVQDGCNNRCTFCITTLARGDSRSRPALAVLADIRAAVDGGAQEVVLTGVHLGSWGQDFSPAQHLADLVRAILRETDVPRLRMSSLEPWDLDGSFFSLWEDVRMCRHLHLPLQSGSRLTLRKMARKVTPESFIELAGQARQAIPGLALTTDVIVGFPGEGEAEFEESLAFVREMNFAAGHVFTYSARPGTAASRYPDQVPHPVRKERNARMRAVLAETGLAYRRQFVGRTLPVLWEGSNTVGPDGWHLNGLTDNYLRVTAIAPDPLWNEVTPVTLRALSEEGMVGEIVW